MVLFNVASGTFCRIKSFFLLVSGLVLAGKC